MFIIINLALLIGVLTFFIETERPLPCAAIFTACKLILGLFYEIGASALAIGGAFTFVFMLLWLWLLNRIEPAAGAWWGVMGGGLLCGVLLGVI